MTRNASLAVFHTFRNEILFLKTAQGGGGGGSSTRSTAVFGTESESTVEVRSAPDKNESTAVYSLAYGGVWKDNRRQLQSREMKSKCFYQRGYRWD